MTLSEIRRNQIAYWFLLSELSKGKVCELFGSFARYCNDAGFKQDDRDRFKALLLINLEELATGGKLEFLEKVRDFGEPLEPLWKFVVIFFYHRGIHLNSNVRRDAGSIAQFVGLTTDEAMEIKGMIALEVHRKIYN